MAVMNSYPSRPRAATCHPIRIAAIWESWYATRLCTAWSDHPTMSLVGAFPVLMFAFANLCFLNTKLPTILSGTPMLCGKAVAL